MGRAVFPPCCLTWGQTVVEEMKIMATSFKRALSALDPAAGHHPPTTSAGTPGQLRASLGQSLVGSLLLSPESWCAEGFVCALQVSVSLISVQSLNRVWLFVTPWIAERQASLSITNSQSSLKLKSIELVMPSSHLILCRLLLLLPPILPSIRVFSNESTLRMRWPKYWSFSFSISPSKEHPWLTSFRMDWLALHAVQGALKSPLQHHSSKASILRLSAFFTVQLSHPYMTTGKTIALT